MNRMNILGAFLLSLLLATVVLADNPDNTAVDTLTAMQQALAKAPAYRETVTRAQGDQTTKIVLEHVAPDRWHVIPPQGPELIVIGDNTYIKLGDNWQKAPAGTNLSAMLQNVQQFSGKDLSQDVVSVTKVGTQVLGKTPTVVYQVVSDVRGVGSTSKIWVGQHDNLPYRLESTSKVPQQKGEVMATVVYDYSANINIEAPK
jgi:outer membrane lipoprotein-sorting protein